MSRKNNSHTGLKVFLILLILVFIAATAFVIKLSLDLPGQGGARGWSPAGRGTWARRG